MDQIPLLRRPRILALLMACSSNLSSWGLIQDSSGQDEDTQSSSSLFSNTHVFCFTLLQCACVSDWLKEMHKHVWSKSCVLICGSALTSYGLWQKPCWGWYQHGNVKRHPTSPLGEWPEMDEGCGLNSPFLFTLSVLFDHFTAAWELELLT